MHKNSSKNLKKHLCSNFLYDGSKLTITIKEPFMALLKFAIFKNGAPDGSIFELLKSQKFDFLRSKNTLILFEKLETYLIA